MPLLSLSFLVLLVFCFILYCCIHVRFRNGLLLAASCIFIGWEHLQYLVVALIITLFTYAWGIFLEKRSAKIIFRSGVLILILSWFVFQNISTASLKSGLLYNVLTMNSADAWFVPLGISFYTFQAISYLTDIYWGREKSEHNPIDFALYMLFFMKFLSGPIERSSSFISQLKRPVSFNYADAVLGLKYILLGLMKKLLIAGYLSPYTSVMFESIHDISGIQLLMTGLLYPIELYTDFSGYTDIAIGGAYLFGLRLSPNFNSPFGAQSITDFWRRWHMSLSFWVRDYIFVPLTIQTRNWQKTGVYLSLIITFVILGLWHGIGASFLIYGLIQGLIVCWEMKVTFFQTHIPRLIGPYMASAFFIARTYLLFALSLLFFKIPSVQDAFYFIRHLSFKAHHSWKEMNIGLSDHECIVAGSALVLLFMYEYFSRRENLFHKLERLPGIFRWSVYFILVLVLFSLARFNSPEFIYLQF